LAIWSGAAVLIALCVLGLVGNWWRPGSSTTIQAIPNGQSLSARVAELTGQIQTWQAREDSLQRRESDAATRNLKLKALQDTITAQKVDLDKQAATLNSQRDAFATQKADLDKQTAAFNVQRDAFATQRADLDKQGAALTAQRDALAKQQVARTTELQRQQNDIAAQSQKLADQQADLDKRTIALKAQQDAVAAKQAAIVSNPQPAAVIAQCDALTGFQYDPDRPQNSGWVASFKNVLNPDAQAICVSATQNAGNDPVLQRRLLLQTGRIYEASGSMDSTISAWKQAANMGSSQAFNELGTYYKQQKDPVNAWKYYMQAAILGNPTALNTVAVSQLFPDWYDNIAAQNTASGLQFLQKALNLDYPRSYYVAGVAYWDSNQTQAIKYLNTSFCMKHDADSDAFYYKKTSRHLNCS
jgi:hypothetical protein